MERVFSVKVKSLVKTEESDEEEARGVYKRKDSEDEESSDSDTDADDTSRSYERVEPPRVRVQYRDNCRIVTNSLDAAINHLFLPKRLPDSSQLEQSNVDDWILQYVSNICIEVLQFKKLQPVRRMLSSWQSTFPCVSHDKNSFVQVFSHEVFNMSVGDTLPVYIRRQNCTLLLTKLSEGSSDGSDFQIETFRPCLPSETIMSNVGSIQATFPETCDVIYNTEMLLSKIFAKHLHELTSEQFKAAMPTASKGNYEFTEHRDVADPFLVSDWLVGLLVPSLREPSTVQITKKVRDEVICRRSAKAVPFRRSGLWTSLKVALHLKLAHTIGNANDARIIYKCLLLRVLADITKYYEEKHRRRISIDLAGQMLAKLGKRVRKLQKMTCEKESTFVEEIKYLWSSTLKFVHTVVSSLHDKMKDIWNECCAAKVADIIEPIHRTKSNLQGDLLHCIPWLNEYIARQSSAAANQADSKSSLTSPPETPSRHSKSKQGAVQILQRFVTLEDIMLFKLDGNQAQTRIWLYDCEKFVKSQLVEFSTGYFSSHEPCSKLFSKRVLELLLSYVKKAVPCYTSEGSENPVGFSQMILTVLQILQVLDETATREHPLLAQYKSGINPGMFDKLLLPHIQDVQLLDRILDYFRDRDLKAAYPGLLDNLMGDLSDNSLATRFAERCDDMLTMHKKLLADMKKSLEERQELVIKVRRQCDELQGKVDACEDCTKSPAEDTDQDGAEKCPECKIVEQSIQEKRFSVPVYERLLPEECHMQLAVVFELMIPEEIKNLREALALLKFELLREQEKKVGKLVKCKWAYFKNMQTYRTLSTEEAGKTFPHLRLKVNLSSQFLPSSSTHHTRIKNPDVMDDSAMSSFEEDDWPFAVPNGMDCVYHYASRNYLEAGKLQKLLAFQIASTNCVNDHNYSLLQWALEGCNHSQNRILSEINVPHHPELVAFGSLRAGHRIQVMNLYRYLSNRQLQLEREPVLALILQTMWETGPRKDYNSGEREAHIDFLDDEFTQEFVQLLETLVSDNDTNYANPLIFTGIVVILGRIMEMNETCRERCYKLLKNCRSCLESWVDKIQVEIKSSPSSLEDDDEFRNIQTKQIEIATCLVLTYNVDSSLFQDVLKEGGDLISWLDAVSTLHDLSSSQSLKHLSSFGQLLVQLAKDVPLKLNLETRLMSSVELKDLFVKSLHLFSLQKWDLNLAVAGSWKLMEDKPLSNIVVGRYQGDMLTFDLLQGSFLVNGYSTCQVPDVIRHNPMFEMYFRRPVKVIQDGVPAANKQILFRTADKFHGKHYEFSVHAVTRRLKIWKVQENNSKLELLDPEKFRGLIGDDLVFGYSHWLDLNTRTVHFRRIPVNDSDYSLAPEYQLRIHDTNLWLLHDQIHNCFLFNRTSQGFDILGGALSRLEEEKRMNIVMSSSSEDGEVGLITVKLPRYHLNFNLVNGHLYCVEYKGFKVAYNQSQRGTLIGLQHGLLLDNIGENINTSGGNVIKRLLIVPHGHLTVVKDRSEHHHRVKVDLTSLRHQPPCFSYELDPVLKRLKADRSKCAWLYLAALHAATSPGVASLPDPFTELSGTEVAVQILQSACVWSCCPYDSESLHCLKMIRKLAPRREYYGHDLTTPKEGKAWVEVPEEKLEQMETTEWPAGLPSMAAFDGYAILVERLLRDSRQLEVLHEPTGSTPMVEMPVNRFKSSEKLQLRAYYRHLSAYNKATEIRSIFLKEGMSKLHGKFKDPELVLRTGPAEDSNEEAAKKKTKWDLKMLLRMSQARLVKTLEDPINESRRKSDLHKFIFGTGEGQEENSKKKEILYPAIPIPDPRNGIPLSDLLSANFKQHWLKLYSMAVNWTGTPEKRTAFSIVLSTLAYHGAPLQQLINLHNVSVLAENINFPILPESVRKCLFSDYSSGSDFSEEKVRQILKEGWSRRNGSYDKYAKEKVLIDANEDVDEKKDDKDEIDTKIDAVIKEIKELWPCEKLSNKKLDELTEKTEKLLSYHDLKQVNSMITGWYRNSLLNTFVETVEAFLDKFYDHFPKLPLNNKSFKALEETKLQVNLEFPSYSASYFENLAGLVIDGDLDEPGVIFYSGSGFAETHIEGMIPTQREQCLAKIDKYLDRIRSATCTTVSKKVICLSGLAPRLNPIYALQCLLHGLNSKPGEFNPGLLKLLGALAVLWTELKRFNRILVLIQSKDKSASELKSELENPGHENWSPVEYPEWLLLELELDIMIRPVQVSVAHQMISMPDGGNGVVQLNMGEGKTSVIVPMLCVTLSKEKNSLCRITVLSSLFKTNLNLLTFTLGGSVLSRRVYTFPCRRDMKFDVETLDKLLKSYQECLKMKGVVVTLPEYRLSFRLLAFDKALKAYPEVGVKFMEIENGLRNYCRDILDESDELLNVKYQLVYTIGMQVNLDGGELRWTTCQKLLQIVQDVAWVFLNKLGASAVEFLKEEQASHPEQFAYIRLLDESGFEEFLSLVADELLKDFKLTDRQKQVTKRFFTQEKISQENFKFVLSLFKNDSELLDEIRLLSGYFRRGILCTALSKRWRVDYGVDPKKNYYRRMAVPFRAKDFVAERTEFGHPDLAIILTHLSYYYSGLSDSQMDQVFDCLKCKPEADSLYASWMGRFFKGTNVPKHLTSYRSINLEDAYQRSHLYSLLRKHKDVIDFWLSSKVFPEECKQFPGKISMSGWDLCYEKTRLPTTGFSGTNDSSILLPLPISQQDLQELQDTNKKMEKVLLLEENQGHHKGLPMGVTCKEILQKLKQDSLRVLIDAGALMLECDNEQVAELWLEIDSDIEAAVYFSKDGEVMVKCRRDYDEADKTTQKGKRRRKSGRDLQEKPVDVQLELSPYRERLEHCGVFLDDQHTRGTDLKFPPGVRACVTIASRMRRDKLMQACMRMRQLGNGHRVCFYLSHEAVTKIVRDPSSAGNEDEPEMITTQAVLDWVTLNSQEHNDEGLVYWALAGKNYAQKLAAQEFHDSVDTHALEKIYCLSRQCVDEEVLTLKDMYGNYTETELLTKLIPEWFEKTQRKLLSVEGCYSLSQRITQRYDNLRDSIIQRCSEYIPTKTCVRSEGLVTLDEEQEKEVHVEKEAEVEEERENVSPPSWEWSDPSGLHENVKQAILQGQKLSVKSGIDRLSEIFAQTSFSKLVQPEGWANAEVFVSTDFISVVKESSSSHFKTDSHLRPIEYLVSIRPQAPKPEKSRKSGPPAPAALQILVISPFEVNELIPYFRDGKTKTHLHMFSARHFQNQDLLVNKIPLQMPRQMTVQLIPDTSKCIAALLAASGNLYFSNSDEQQMFARFLGLVPRPWTPEQMNAFEKEFIKKSGFLLPKYRRQEMESCQIEQAAFQKDPIPLIKKILLCRHAVISDVAHVNRLLNRNWYVDIN